MEQVVKTNVALYARVSKDEASSTGKTQDPENQLIPLREFCNKMGWNIKEEFIERASGANSNRPVFQKMLGQVRQRRFDIILVWKLDRFSREGIINTMSYVKQLREYKTRLKGYEDEWLDTERDGIYDAILGLMAYIAEDEVKNISKRTKSGLRKLELKGIKGGRHRNDCQCKIHAKKRGVEKSDDFHEVKVSDS